MKIRHAGREEKIALQMTPMIDVVFQLLVFFVMTFKIVLPEGDFNIRMPSASNQVSARPSETPTLRIEMRANEDGSLAALQIGEISFGNDGDAFLRLHQYVRDLVGDAAGPDGNIIDQEVELDCDYNLSYDYVIRAITAITGYIENGQQQRLIERIKFSPLRKSN